MEIWDFVCYSRGFVAHYRPSPLATKHCIVSRWKVICIRRRSPVERMVARSRRVSRRLSSHGSAATATTGSCTKYTLETKGASSRISDTDLQHGKLTYLPIERDIYGRKDDRTCP